MAKLIVFSTKGYDLLADDVAERGSWDRGSIKEQEFDYGNFTLSRETDVSAKDVLLIGGTISPMALSEVLRKGAFLVHQGARSFTVFNPYMATCRLEKEGPDGEDVAAKWEAEQFDSLPSPSLLTKLRIADMHAPTVVHYFNRSRIQVRESWLESVTFDAVKSLGGGDFILGGADAGSLKWTLSWANRLGVDWVTNLKDRKNFAPQGIGMIGTSPKGKKVVMFDDILQTGTSALIAAQTFLDHGATEVSAVFSHTVGKTLDKVRESGLISRIITTDSHPQARVLASDSNGLLTVKTIAGVIVSDVKKAWGW